MRRSGELWNAAFMRQRRILSRALTCVLVQVCLDRALLIVSIHAHRRPLPASLASAVQNQPIVVKKDSSVKPVVGIIMGSDSDWPTMKAAAEACAEFGLGSESRVISAHRTP